MPVWTFRPQQVYAETMVFPARINNVTLAKGVVGLDDFTAVRQFRLQYGPVTSDSALAMRTFFLDRSGPYEPFDFVNPNDSLIYRVRFASTMKLELFTPSFFAANPLILEVV